MIRITKTGCAFEKEPLSAPFGFKGGYVDELWQSIVAMEDEEGNRGLGLGVQSVLWSDPLVFQACGHERGNNLMSGITRHALRAAEGLSFKTPFSLINALLATSSQFSSASWGSSLRRTFLLNALVPIDQAAWMLTHFTKPLASFKDLIPPDYHSALTANHDRIACVPAVSYGMSEEDVEELVRNGSFVLKIKLGSDPDGDGDEGKMLAWDRDRLHNIHQRVKHYETQYTDNGFVAYYLDFNGRYTTRDQLNRLTGAADRMGALERILLVEEPFQEHLQYDVRDFPFRVTGDESVHSEEDALERIEMGYGAFALKPVAKTMSLSLRIAGLAAERGIPCFCADLTANPLMVDWNKNLAAHLPPVPGLSVGLIESNGAQNYSNWNQMKRFHPRSGAEWMEPIDGLFRLSADFYSSLGGVFERSAHYNSLVFAS